MKSSVVLYWECKNCKVKGSVRTTQMNPRGQYLDAEENHNQVNEESKDCKNPELELS